ncbi:hypothetical protein [Streptacidiphilus cavernicola]|uniref:Uncharacterized protein n=1 Tax=Streptacidiphilus cavernicola TaxID=3342716 RepID=A0ABV6VXT6_9ACTN
MTKICIRCGFEIRDGHDYQPVQGGGFVHYLLCCRECGAFGPDDLRDPRGDEHEGGCSRRSRTRPPS